MECGIKLQMILYAQHKTLNESYLSHAPGLGWRLAGWQAGWQADEIQVNFENFKIGCRLKYSSFRFV